MTKIGVTVATTLMASVLLSACEEPITSDEFLTRAQEYRDKGDLLASTIEAKNALRINRNDQDARYILGQNYLDLGDWLSAEATLETALGQGGLLEYAIVPSLARAKLQLGKLDDALKVAAVKSDMSDELKGRILVVRGRAYTGLKNHDAAKKSFNDALAADPKAFGAYLGLAGLAIGLGDHDKGDDLLAKAVEIAPDALDVLEFRARYHFQKEEFADAEKIYRSLLDIRPTRVAYHSGLVNTLIATQKFKQAIEQLEPLLARNPKNVQLNYLRALVAYRSQDYVAAYNYSGTVLGIHKRHVQSLLIAGAAAYAKKEYGQAAQFLQQYLLENPSHTDVRILLGDVQLRLNRVVDATATLETAAKAKPDNINLLMAIGRASNMAGDLQKGSDYFQRASDLKPDDSSARAAYGASQIALGQTDIGIRELEKAVKEDADLSTAEIALILSLAKEKRFDEALAATVRLQKRHPERAISYTVEGLLQFSKGDKDKAEAAFKSALKLKPGAADAAVNLASIALVGKKPKKARGILTEVLKHKPRDHRALAMLADIHMRLGDADPAAKAYEQLLEVVPESLDARVKLAQILFVSGRIQKAYLAAKGGPVAHQNEPAILEILGQSQSRLGMRAEANESFRSLVEAKPDSAHAKFLLANSYAAISKLADAQRALEGALSLKPQEIRYKAALADLFLRQNSLDKASSAIGELLSAAPDKPEYLYLKGRLALQKNQPEAAIGPLSKAYRTKKNAQLTALLARAQMKAKGRGVGLETLRQWLKDNPKDINIRFQLANSYVMFDQHNEAVKQLEILIKDQPENWVFLNNLASSLVKLGKNKEALPYARRAYNVASNHPAVLDTFGVVLLANGQNGQAAEVLSLANRRAPNHPEIAYNAARALQRVGETDKARAILLNISPANSSPELRKKTEDLLKKLGS